MKKRVIASFMTLLMAASLLAGCGGSSSASSAAAPAASTEAKEESKEEAAETAEQETAPAADAITIKLATSKPSNTYAYQGLLRFADKVKEDSNGTMIVEVYADSQLGGQVEVIEGMEMGTIEMAYLAAGAAEQFYPKLGMMTCMFVATDEEHALRIWNSDKAREVTEAMANDIGVHNFDYSIEGVRNIWSKKSVESLEDLKGLKMRVPEVPIFIASFETLGVNPTPMTIADVYTALQTGVIDGLEYDVNGIMDFNFYDHCKYCYETAHVVSLLGFMASDIFWSSLTTEQQEILQAAMKQITEELNEEYYSAKEEAQKQLEAEGVTFVKPSEEELANIAAMMNPITIDYVKDYATEEDIEYFRNI